jgi:hypothetical protein
VTGYRVVQPGLQAGALIHIEPGAPLQSANAEILEDAV